MNLFMNNLLWCSFVLFICFEVTSWSFLLFQFWLRFYESLHWKYLFYWHVLLQHVFSSRCSSSAGSACAETSVVTITATPTIVGLSLLPWWRGRGLAWRRGYQGQWRRQQHWWWGQPQRGETIHLPFLWQGLQMGTDTVKTSSFWVWKRGHVWMPFLSSEV